MSKNLYVYEIINWEPINTNSMNLLSKVNIKPDIKLLELFNKSKIDLIFHQNKQN